LNVAMFAFVVIGGVLSGLDRVLLGRQTERVPTHRMQHVHAGHAQPARPDVRRGVALRVADVEPRARRVREHVEDVRLAASTGVVRAIRAVLEPVALPLRFDRRVIERFALRLAHHDLDSQSSATLDRIRGGARRLRAKSARV
jgi:hypothetical protein